MKKTKLDIIKDDIRRYFGFLFDRGYKFRDDSFSQAPVYWSIELYSLNCNIRIRSDRDELFITFSSLMDRSYEIGLEPLIYFLSKGEDFIGPFEGNLAWGKKKQFERLANLLQRYIDQIEPLLGTDFYKYKVEIIAAGGKYVAQSIQNYRNRHYRKG